MQEMWVIERLTGCLRGAPPGVAFTYPYRGVTLIVAKRQQLIAGPADLGLELLGKVACDRNTAFAEAPSRSIRPCSAAANRDFRARSIHPKSNPPNAGTGHLGQNCSANKWGSASKATPKTRSSA